MNACISGEELGKVRSMGEVHVRGKKSPGRWDKDFLENTIP